MFFAFTYIIVVHCQTLFDLLFSIIMNCVKYSVFYESLTGSISTQLNSPGKTWKLDINCPWKFWKMHIKRSWKVMKNHFQCSVCTQSITSHSLWTGLDSAMSTCVFALDRQRRWTFTSRVKSLMTSWYRRRVHLLTSETRCLDLMKVRSHVLNSVTVQHVNDLYIFHILEHSVDLGNAADDSFLYFLQGLPWPVTLSRHQLDMRIDAEWFLRVILHLHVIKYFSALCFGILQCPGCKSSSTTVSKSLLTETDLPVV